MITNIIIISIVVLFIVIGVFRGFLGTVLGFVSVVAALICSYYLSGILGKLVYDMFIADELSANISEYIYRYGASYAADNFINALPSWAEKFISVFAKVPDFDVSMVANSVNISADNAISTTTTLIVDAVADLVVPLISSVFMMFLFLVLMIIFKLISRVILKIVDFPVLKQINAVLGGVFGAAEGVIVVFLVALIAYYVMSSNYPQLLKDSSVTGVLFKTIYNSFRLN
ncbi:MAG: CvpA family protein [Ruminococcus sp.]|nr:CvpA family protein [Ruminococcus sp.]